MTSTASAEGSTGGSRVTQYQMYIDGRSVGAASGRTFDVYAPSTEAVIATCCEYYGGLATKVHGEVLSVPADAMVVAMCEPVGEAGQSSSRPRPPRPGRSASVPVSTAIRRWGRS